MPRVSKEGTYYIGRIVCRGVLDKKELINTLSNPPDLSVGQYNWTITNFREYKSEDKAFYFGKLSKYEPQGTVDIVVPESHSEAKKDEENVRIASSPFIFLPEYSGIAYLHVWNKIEQQSFVRRFTSIVMKDKIMVDCDIDPISDISNFYKKISDLTSINQIQAKVHPPNPLFGPIWEDLKKYLHDRQVSELRIDEKAARDESIVSNIKKLVSDIQQQKKLESIKVDFGDAAIIMATDGYGRGKIKGHSGKKTVVIQTSETIKTFQFSSDPEPFDLYKTTRMIFEEINQKRYMKHDE